MKDGAARTIDRIWNRIPEVECRGLCQDACGPVSCSDAEAQRIKDRHDEELGFHPLTMQCDLLVDGRCSIYASRPAICRLYGAVKKMRCPHGCRPKKFLSDRSAGKIFRDLDALSDGPSMKEMQVENQRRIKRGGG